jgi:hypothetical protein
VILFQGFILIFLVLALANLTTPAAPATLAHLIANGKDAAMVESSHANQSYYATSRQCI